TIEESRWSVEGYPQSATLDLGGDFRVEEFRIYPFQERDYKYTISESSNGSSWTQVVDRSQSTQSSAVLVDPIEPVTARFVRLTVTGSTVYTGAWISIGEFEVYGEESSEWAGYPIVDGHVFAGGKFLSWMYAVEAPWL